MTVRISETLTGYVYAKIFDQECSVLAVLIERRTPLWDVEMIDEGCYRLAISLRHLPILIAVAKRNHAKVRFERKVGLPFLVWRAKRRKMFLAGALFFVATLYGLSSFIWHVNIDGTDQPEAMAAALAKLNIYPGSLFYKVMDQDSVQLALLDQLPNISWVGVRFQGTAVYVHVVPRVLPAPPKRTYPQEIIARVPGVVAAVLADTGMPMVKPGQFVPQGSVLISGVLEDGKEIHASGKVDAIVWYRTDITLPMTTTVYGATGDFVRHYYLMIGSFPLQVWGFSHPPYGQTLVQDEEHPLTFGQKKLPFTWRVETVYEAKAHTGSWTASALVQRGLSFVASDVLAEAPEQAKVLKQNVLQKKLEHGKLYMTVWTEVLEDIGKAHPLSTQQVGSQ